MSKRGPGNSLADGRWVGGEVRRIAVTVMDTSWGRVETALAAPAPALRPYFETYHGYRETGGVALRRLEVPLPKAALILGFGEPVAVSLTGRAGDLEGGYGAFLAGLTTGPALVESHGSQAGVQVDLTPLGARRLFGVPMAALTNRAVRIDDLLGRPGTELIERLRQAGGWEERYDLLDRVFLTALAANPAPPRPVDWAWERISTAPGRLHMGKLAEEIGWSHKHFISRFREEVGLAPALAGRLVRFDRAVAAVRQGGGAPWSAVAAEAGYFDQAHMVRDFRVFAHCTPSQFRARQLPDGGTRGDGLEETGR